MAHATSFDREVNIIAACGTNERCCVLGANDVLRNEVMLRINEVALRANGIKP